MKLPLSVIALATSSSSSPELPMHVVQPYPIKLKPILSKYFCKPLILRHRSGFSWFEAKQTFTSKTTRPGGKYYLFWRYLVTAPDPGAGLVLIHGLTCQYTKVTKRRAASRGHFESNEDSPQGQARMPFLQQGQHQAWHLDSKCLCNLLWQQSQHYHV